MRLNQRSSRSIPHRSIRLALIGLVLLGSSFFPYAAQAGSATGDPIWNIPIKQNKVPSWLKVGQTTQDLYSEYALATLTGHLINVGLATTPGCPSAGLEKPTKANRCGVKAAASASFEWQNRFNADILSASQETGVPPILLKNIFAWESEFWPDTIFVNTTEFGLGHMTNMGADSLLRWNYPFYDSFCRATLAKDQCEKVYVDQTESTRATLRGLVLQQVNSTCAGCKYGLDLPRAQKSVHIFASTVIANTKLVKHYIKAYTGQNPADTSGYEDLWDFTLVSYNAGPGCFKTALSRTVYSGLPLTWKNLSSKLDPACQGAIPYIKFISQTDSYHPQDAPQANPTPTETLASPTQPVVDTPAATSSPTPEASPTATAEPSVTSTADLSSSTPATDVPTGTPATELATGTPATDTTTPQSTNAASETASPTATDSAASPTPTGTAAPTEAASTSTASISDALVPIHVGNELIVKIDPSQRDAGMQTLKSAGIDLAQSPDQQGLPDILVVQVDPGQLETTLATLDSGKGIAFAEPNYLAGITSFGPAISQPNDPLYSSQTNLPQIQVPEAWATLTAEQPVIVAVLDTGVDTAQPDLAGAIFSNPGEANPADGTDDDGNGFVDDAHGWNFVDGTNNVSDDNGHGTHLAGIIAASSNNGIGVAGIAPNARILPVKVLDKNGYGTYANIADGIIYATNMGARVINMGFGGVGSSAVLQDAVNYALLHDVLLVAAAGNSGNSATYYPAGYSGVVGVGAVDSHNALTDFSSTGDGVSLVAPGAGIVSTGLNAAYVTMSGTSMAAAHVSGVAALLGGQPNPPDVTRLRSDLLGGAVDLGASGRDKQYGYGMVQAIGALTYSGPSFPISIMQDGVEYVLTGSANAMNASPTVNITAPANNSSYAEGATVAFSGTASDAEDGDLSSKIVWYSNLTGPIGTGKDVTSSALMPGKHTITAQATDSLGALSSASITITISGSSGPHGGFNGNTDQCATCHRTHSAKGDTYLTTDPSSVNSSDSLCLTCHTTVSTHSNKDWGSAVEPSFEVRCIQCHDAHGSSNLFGIRTDIITTINPQALSGPVLFTSLTGTNSYDDGVSSNRLCVVCHSTLANHPGGSAHFDGTNYTLDYTGQSCVACHPHNADTNPATLDGFMPVRSTNP